MAASRREENRYSALGLFRLRKTRYAPPTLMAASANQVSA